MIKMCEMDTYLGDKWIYIYDKIVFHLFFLKHWIMFFQGVWKYNVIKWIDIYDQNV